jgi:hypothetical protein
MIGNKCNKMRNKPEILTLNEFLASKNTEIDN